MLTEPGRTLLERWIYALVKVDGDWLCPYTPQRWAAVGEDRSYGADFVPFLERFLAAVQQGPWAPGSYYPGGWYRTLTAHGEAPARTAMAPGALKQFQQEELRVDRAGAWWVGPKAVTGRVLRHFLRHLRFDAELGRYAVRHGTRGHLELRYLHHESPPIRVRRVTLAGPEVTLLLNTGQSEPLRPETLRLDAAEQLYCAVGAEALPAWFEEPARWELLKDAAEQDGQWVLRVAGRPLAAPLGAPWPYADALPG